MPCRKAYSRMYLSIYVQYLVHVYYNNSRLFHFELCPQIVMTSFLETFIFIHYVIYCFWRGMDSGLPILLELIRQCKFNFCFQPFHIIQLLTGVEGNIGYVEPEVEMSKCNILDRGPITMLSEPLVNECFVNIPYQYICLNI